jgi:hypothetical protein
MHQLQALKIGTIIVTVKSSHGPTNMDKEPNIRASHPSSQIDTNKLHFPLHRNDMSNAPHHGVRKLPQATFMAAKTSF